MEVFNSVMLEIIFLSRDYHFFLKYKLFTFKLM